MESSLPLVKPIVLVRPRGAHRFEAFSPKLQRRITFCRRFLLELWVLLETDPAVVAFCERPGYIQIEGRPRLADFLVRYVDHDELAILTDCDINSVSEATNSHRPLDGNALSIRRVGPAELAAARVWIENWQRMLPYVVANHGLISPTLSEAIVRFVAVPQRLLAIEREFSIGDPVGSVAVRRSAMMCGTTRTTESSMKTLNPAVARVLKRLHYPLEVILTCVRWYVAYPLSLRHLEDMMAERGVSVDHSTVHRWAIKRVPQAHGKEVRAELTDCVQAA